MTSQVEGTNDSSCLSKLSAASRNYFKDEFLFSFVNKCPRRAPLINLGYSVRAAIINFLMEEFLTKNFEKQVVSLGAGFDTLFFKSKSKNTELKVVYFELDLLGGVERKIACIQRSETLSQLIGQHSVSEGKLISSDYCLLAVDLRDISAVRTLLTHHNLDPNLPTLFLSECAITYLEEKRSSELICFASEFLNATFVTYEQVHPEDGFGQVMVAHFASLHSPLRSVSHYPTLHEQRQRYIDHGWQHCSALSAVDAYLQVTSPEERQRVLRLEPFDEFEELYLKCCHYAVIISSQGSLAHWSFLCTPDPPILVTDLRPTLEWTLTECETGMRYGHSVLDDSTRLLLHGGFGVRRDGSHGRLKDVVTLNCSDSAWKAIGETSEYTEIDESMFTTTTAGLRNCWITYGGRTAPTQCIRTTPEITQVKYDGCKRTFVYTPLVNNFNAPARWKHTAVVAHRNNCETFIVFGGRTSSLELLNDTWMVSLKENPSERTVSTLLSESIQPCPRFSHTAVVQPSTSGSEDMWVCGGMGQDTPLADVWCLHLHTGQWTEVPVPGLLPRFGHAACLRHGRMILVGGVNQLEDRQPGVAVVDLESRTCVEYKLPMMEPQKGLLLVNHCLVQEEENLLVIGGGGNCFSFGTFFNKQIAKIKVKDLCL